MNIEPELWRGINKKSNLFTHIAAPAPGYIPWNILPEDTNILNKYLNATHLSRLIMQGFLEDTEAEL